MKIYVHGSYIGNTGFNNHTRDFFRELSKHAKLKVRNFTVGNSWSGYNSNPHNGELYLNEIDKNILYEQSLWVDEKQRKDFKIYPDPNKEFNHDFNIVLNETNHHFFYDHYSGPKIAYTVWESTLLPEEFFDKLKEYDEVWTPSKWQKDCMVKQGMTEEFIKVVPEGVDDKVFFPENVDLLDEYKDGRFKFILFGRWDYRKSTKEIIETFLKTFDNSDPVDLIVSIDNPFGESLDGLKSTEERLSHYDLNDERIKIVHFPSRENYIKFIKTGHVFVSCARAEGWNLPLIEAMACGTPSIYSNCSGQLEFAEGKGIPVNIIKEVSTNNNTYGRFSMGEIPGNYYEPDFNDLSQKMRFVYENYNEVKAKAIIDSIEIRKNFNWQKIGKIGYGTCVEFYNKINTPNYKKPIKENKIYVSFIDGPKVEIKGDFDKEYFIEFIDADKNEIVHSSVIKNNMWTCCNRKYYTNWIIKINGEIFERFDCTNKNVLIAFESKSIGDTIAWAPYAVEFAKKHNCNVILSTFHNEWFKGLENYKLIDFIEPGNSVNVYCVFRIGWFKGDTGLWDKFDYYPNVLNTVPLQQTATDILGLVFSEKNYGVNYIVKPRPISQKYIVFGPNSTAGAKEWKYEHWLELTKNLRDKGFEIVTLTNKPFYIENTINIFGSPFDEVMNYLYHAEIFIGLASGLSWLNWALGKKTIMISGFSKEGHEFTSNVIRISNDSCIKCWNDPVLPFDASDWDWCPVYKGTEKQHICQKSILPQHVLNKLEL